MSMQAKALRVNIPYSHPTIHSTVSKGDSPLLCGPQEIKIAK